MLRLFPLPLIAVILYNLIAFGWQLAGHPDVLGLLSWGVPVPLPSGAVWRPTGSDLLLLIAFALLFAEIVQSTRASARAFVHHALALLTFVVALAEFLLLKGFATSVFFFIVLTTLFDVCAGYTISSLAAKCGADPRVDRHHGEATPP